MELVPGERIVQSWRTQDFTDEHEDSIITVTLEEVAEGTLLTLVHSNVPKEQTSYERGGWQEHYFDPMQEYFAKRAGGKSKKAKVKARTKPKPAARASSKAKTTKKERAAAKAKPKTKAKSAKKAKGKAVKRKARK